MVDACFIEAGSSKGAAVESLHANGGCDWPHHAEPRHNIQIQFADLVGLEPADQMQPAADRVLELCVECFAGPVRVGNRDRWIHAFIELRALAPAVEGAKSELIASGDRDDVAPLQQRLVGVAVYGGKLRDVEDVPRVGKIKTRGPPGCRLKTVAKIAETALPFWKSGDAAHERSGVPVRE